MGCKLQSYKLQSYKDTNAMTNERVRTPYVDAPHTTLTYLINGCNIHWTKGILQQIVNQFLRLTLCDYDLCSLPTLRFGLHLPLLVDVLGWFAQTQFRHCSLIFKCSDIYRCSSAQMLFDVRIWFMVYVLQYVCLMHRRYVMCYWTTIDDEKWIGRRSRMD